MGGVAELVADQVNELGGRNAASNLVEVDKVQNIAAVAVKGTLLGGR